MSVNINLISSTDNEDPRKKRLRKLKNFSFILLFLVGFMSVMVFLINYRFSVNYVRGQQRDLIKKISIYDDTAIKIILLNSRLDDISTLLNNRPKYNKIAAEIAKGLDSSVNVKEVKIEEGGISISVSSSSLLSLNEFLNNILRIKESRLITSVNLESLSIESSAYVIEIGIQ